jgi:putative CocE/NonD family hydrolase
MGPWTHGAWSRPDWSKFGPLTFGQNTAQHYRQTLELPFFNYYLKGKGTFGAAEATMFNTGTNEWKDYAVWPPKATSGQAFYLSGAGLLATTSSATPTPADEYVSDPAHPVPYTNGVFEGRNNEYMIEDQRFAAQRPDVLVYQTEPLAQDLTIAGPITADLWVSTSGTDADFVVKVIDVLPDDTPNPEPNPKNVQLAGAQRLVRAEVMRGRFRNSFEKPEAFQPNVPTEVKYQLNDVLHTFKKGHRLMVQVQSTWFPLVDRNPQTFVNISTAEAKDFQKATIRLYHEPGHASVIQLPVLGQ